MPLKPLKDFVMDGDASPAEHHDIERFMKDLNAQLLRPFLNQTRPYAKVQVLLLCWERADSDNDKDVYIFSEFLRREFNVEITCYKIGGTGSQPDYKSFRQVMTAFSAAEDRDTLSIIFHSGHGYSSYRQKDPKPIAPKWLILLQVESHFPRYRC